MHIPSHGIRSEFVEIDSSDRLFLCYVSGSKASIFVRKALHIRLRDRNMRSVLLARREGYALFDEDDVCAGS